MPSRAASGLVDGGLGVVMGIIALASMGAAGSVGGQAYSASGGVVASSPVYDAVAGLMGGAESAVLFMVPYLAVGWLAGPWAAALAGALCGSQFYLVLLLLRTDERTRESDSSLFGWHPARWCERLPLRLPGLDAHLTLLAEREPSRAHALLDLVAATPQRWAARAAQLELYARWLERCVDLRAIGLIHTALSASKLAGDAHPLRRSFARLSKDVDAALHYATPYTQRLALAACGERLNSLLRELVRTQDQYAIRLRSTAARFPHRTW